MKKKATGDLSQELMSQPNPDVYIHNNRMSFTNENFADLLATLFEKKNIPKAVLARQSGISEVYLHQVFSGRRNPSRDRLPCICIGLEATLEETHDGLILNFR